MTLAFLLLSILTNPAIAQERNNINLVGIVQIEMNMTIINTGDLPKFVIVNPRYNFQVIRENMSEVYSGSEITSPEKNVLNYRLGFWIYPHEVVKVKLSLNTSMPLTHFQTPLCAGRIFVEGDRPFVEVPDTFEMPICEVLIPQLVNSPMYLTPESFFLTRDQSLVLYSYEGVVTFKIKHELPPNLRFRDVFAVSPPILFLNAKVYSYYPRPTMNYTEYLKFIREEFGLDVPKPVKLNITEDTILYDMKLGLLSTSQTLPQIQKPRFEEIDYPVWIVWLGSGSSIEIRYRFEWRLGGEAG